MPPCFTVTWRFLLNLSNINIQHDTRKWCVLFCKSILLYLHFFTQFSPECIFLSFLQLQHPTLSHLLALITSVLWGEGYGICGSFAQRERKYIGQQKKKTMVKLDSWACPILAILARFISFKTLFNLSNVRCGVTTEVKIMKNDGRINAHTVFKID